MYYFYYLVLRSSSDLCAAYLDYSATLTQTLCPCSTNGLLPAARLTPGLRVNNVQHGALDLDPLKISINRHRKDA